MLDLQIFIPDHDPIHKCTKNFTREFDIALIDIDLLFFPFCVVQISILLANYGSSFLFLLS